jgi:hypothetical protein
MEAERFDQAVRALALAASRRRSVLAVLGGLLVAALPGLESDAKRRGEHAHHPAHHPHQAHEARKKHKKKNKCKAKNAAACAGRQCGEVVNNCKKTISCGRCAPPASCQNGACVPDGGGPLVGLWQEEVQFACGSGAEVPPAVPIGELAIRGDGTLAVTWVPFEVYHDYWATYVADLSQQTFSFQVTGGNYIPPDIDGEGHVALDEQGRLRLTELWLGSPAGPAGPARCGHRFRRFGT